MRCCVIFAFMRPLFISRLGLFFCSIVIVGCNFGERSQSFAFKRLIGFWTSLDTLSAQSEQWTQLNDSVFVGSGCVLEKGDTTFFEVLEIRKVSGRWTYSAKVGQEQGIKPVVFLMTRQSERLIEFSNDLHDFPKKIGYEFLDDNRLQAYIEGPRDGQTIRILFDYQKKTLP